MEYNPKLLEYSGQEKRLIYDGITLQLTAQLVEDWVFQTGEHPGVLILYYWSKHMATIRHEKINSVLQNNSNRNEINNE